MPRGDLLQRALEPGVSTPFILQARSARRRGPHAAAPSSWPANALYVAGRSPGPVIEAACWSHSRRKFFELADIAASARRGKNAPPISPVALEAVKRIDVLFDIERGIVGESADHRLAVRKELSAPVLADLKDWMETERRKLSKHAPVAKAMDYMLRRWELFARFLDDGRICLTNNAAERALRGIALGRKSWLFCGSDRKVHKRRARGGDVHADRHRQAQRCRSAGLARRCPRPDRGDAAEPARRITPLELGPRAEASIKPHRPGPRGRRPDPAPKLHRRHHPATKISLKYPAVFGGCLPWNWVPEQKLDQAAWARSHADRPAPSQPLLKIRLNTPAVFGGCIRVSRQARSSTDGAAPTRFSVTSLGACALGKMRCVAPSVLAIFGKASRLRVEVRLVCLLVLRMNDPGCVRRRVLSSVRGRRVGRQRHARSRTIPECLSFERARPQQGGSANKREYAHHRESRPGEGTPVIATFRRGPSSSSH